MRHEEAAALIADLHKGRLDPAAEQEVREHMGTCDECRSVSQTYSLLLAGVRREPGAHPLPAQLVHFALGEAAAGEPELRRVGEHVAACESCSREAAAVREAEATLAIAKARPAPARPRFRSLLAAAVVLVLFGEVVRLRLARDPGLREAEGVFGLSLLTGALRDGAAPTILAVGAGQTTVALAVAPALPSELPDAAPLSVRIVGEAGRETFARDITARDLRKLSGASGVFALYVPASKLPAGRYTLYIHAQSEHAPLFRTDFAVQRTD